jgi:succinate-acetate transporter protein
MLRVRDIAHRDIMGVPPDAPLKDALAQLEEHGGQPLPVIADGEVVGVVTEREIVNWEIRGGENPALTPVRDVMRTDIPFAYDDQDVRDATERIRDKHANGLVVLRHADKRVLGTVSLEELATRAMEEGETGRADGVLSSARVFLQPIAAPSILGLYGFAGATFMVAANMAGWFGSATSGHFLFPFAAFFGGLAQFAAGMWAYRARDGLATAMHGTWGAFWMGYGVLNLLFSTGTLTPPTGAFPELAYWFIALAAITWVGAWAALAFNGVLTGVLGFLALGSTLAAIGFGTGSTGTTTLAGWSFIASAVIAWYFASAMMLAGTYDRIILPFGGYHKMLNRPGSRPFQRMQIEHAEPGVKAGQ